jgi:hypothetical protein
MYSSEVHGSQHQNLYSVLTILVMISSKTKEGPIWQVGIEWPQRTKKTQLHLHRKMVQRHTTKWLAHMNGPHSHLGDASDPNSGFQSFLHYWKRPRSLLHNSLYIIILLLMPIQNNFGTPYSIIIPYHPGIGNFTSPGSTALVAIFRLGVWVFILNKMQCSTNWTAHMHHRNSAIHSPAGPHTCAVTII